MTMILFFQDEQVWLSLLLGGVPDGITRFHEKVSANNGRKSLNMLPFAKLPKIKYYSYQAKSLDFFCLSSYQPILLGTAINQGSYSWGQKSSNFIINLQIK